MDEQSVQRKRPAAVLTKSNWETWFILVETHLRSKNVFYTIEKTKKEYAWVQRYTPTTTTSTQSGSSSSQDKPLEELVSSFERLGGVMNQEKADKYDTDKAMAMYNIVICLSQLDIEMIEGKDEMKDKWAVLKTKYSRVLPAEHRQNVKALNDFKMDQDMTINDTWTTINELRRKIVNSKPALRANYSEDVMFEILTQALPSEYDVIVDVLDHQSASLMTIDEKLRELESKEAKLKRGKETAAYGQTRGRRTTRQDYTRYDKSRSRSPRCYLCEGNHLIRDCTVLQDLKQMAKGVKYLKKTSKVPASRTSRTKASILKPKPKLKAKPTSDNNDAMDIDKHGYNAEDIDEDSDEN